MSNSAPIKIFFRQIQERYFPNKQGMKKKEKEISAQCCLYQAGHFNRLPETCEQQTHVRKPRLLQTLARLEGRKIIDEK